MQIDIREARRALEAGEFVPFFQPQIGLRNGQISGFELLARWNNPRRGFVEPDDFIPQAERDGWVGDLTRDLLRQGFAAFAQLPKSLRLAVNIAPLQLRDRRLPDDIRDAASVAEFSMERLTIEITESALADGMEHAGGVAEELKLMGCRLALDDFGTGYSSLLYLQSLPFDELKVDQSFVSSMTARRESRKIVAAVVGLGQSLGLRTVGEGVETKEQEEMLLWLGCDVGQGWLFGRPLPAERLTEVLATPRERGNPETGKLEPDKHPTRASSESRRSYSNFDSQPTRHLAQLQAVYDGAPVGLAFLDCDMRYVTLNQRLAELNGYTVEEHLGRTVAEMVPAFFPMVEDYIRRALGGESFEAIEMIKPIDRATRGKTVLISYHPGRDEAGEVVGVSVSLLDLTLFKDAEEARRESEQHFQHLLDLNPQIPWVMDSEGRVVVIGRRWEEVSGLAVEDARNFGWLDALHSGDVGSTKERLQNSLQTGEPIDLEYRVRAKGGTWRWMRSRGYPRFDDLGKVLFWYGGAEDIDDLKRDQ